VILVVIGSAVSMTQRAPIRRVEASMIWNWLGVDELRHAGDRVDVWRRQDATPWSMKMRRLEPGEQRVTVFEVRPYDWDGTRVRTRLPPPSYHPGIQFDAASPEHLGTLKVRFVDHHGIPGEMSGRLRLNPVAAVEAEPPARMAVATLAWARKLRGDRQLRRLSWRRIEQLVPETGVPADQRDALKRAIRQSRAL
jgi:hypothetical protein